MHTKQQKTILYCKKVYLFLILPLYYQYEKLKNFNDYRQDTQETKNLLPEKQPQNEGHSRSDY